MSLRTIAVTILLDTVSLHAAGWHVDLADWGYRPQAIFLKGESCCQRRYLDFDKDNNVLGSFVTPPPSELITANTLGLTLHVLTLNSKGKFISDRTFPTTDQLKNVVLAMNNGNVLLVVDKLLKLVSAEGNVLAERDLPDDLRVFYSPDRSRLGLYGFVEPKYPLFPAIQMDSKDLAKTIECSYPGKNQVLSISEHNLVMLFGKTEPPFFPKQLEVRTFRGETQFTYAINQGEPILGTFLDDNRLLLADGGPMVEAIDRGVRVWRDMFDRRLENPGPYVSVDKLGNRVAVLVDKHTAGNRFLDISGTLKSQRVVVYDARNGKRLAEVPVPKLSKFLLEFALSPDGKLLAIKCDADLQVTAIDQR